MSSLNPLAAAWGEALATSSPLEVTPKHSRGSSFTSSAPMAISGSRSSSRARQGGQEDLDISFFAEAARAHIVTPPGLPSSRSRVAKDAVAVEAEMQCPLFADHDEAQQQEVGSRLPHAPPPSRMWRPSRQAVPRGDASNALPRLQSDDSEPTGGSASSFSSAMSGGTASPSKPINQDTSGGNAQDSEETGAQVDVLVKAQADMERDGPRAVPCSGSLVPQTLAKMGAINLQDFELMRLVGQGAFGKVRV